MSKTAPFGSNRCPNCGEYGSHYCGPSFGDEGFFICKKKGEIMHALKCSIHVVAGVVPNQPLSELTRHWEFTEEDLNNPPTYVDRSGAAMNYAMSLQNPEKVNWVKLEWIWY